jgi:hypothetical protein
MVTRSSGVTVEWQCLSVTKTKQTAVPLEVCERRDSKIAPFLSVQRQVRSKEKTAGAHESDQLGVLAESRRSYSFLTTA